MPVNVVVQFKTLAEKQTDFLVMMESVKAELPQIPGCLAVSVLQSVGDPRQFTLVETWENQDRHRTHIEGLLADGTWARIESLLESRPVSGYFQML